MIFDFINLAGYGQYVWPAFILTFSSCFYLYFKTKVELRNLEKIFQIDIENKQIKRIKFVREKENREENLPVNSI